MNHSNKKHWDYYLDRLEEWYNTTELKPIKIGCYTVSDPALLFEGHLEICRFNKGNPRFIPYLQRMMDYKAAIENTPTLTL